MKTSSQCVSQGQTDSFCIKDTISKELNQLEHEGILKKVNHSEWAIYVYIYLYMYMWLLEFG